MVQVRMSVAIVIPEIGFDEEPMRPVIRDETVTKKKPKTMTSTETRKLPCVGMPGAIARTIASSSDPPSTIDIGRARSGGIRAVCDFPAPKSFLLSRYEEAKV